MTLVPSKALHRATKEANKLYDKYISIDNWAETVDHAVEIHRYDQC